MPQTDEWPFEPTRLTGRSSSGRARVLHVIESFGGGVSDAAASFAESTPDYEHHLIYSLRDDAQVSDDAVASFATAEHMRSGNASRIAQISRRSRALDTDIIHAHSSYAGVYARLARRRQSVPIVYSPHCFAFERTDLSGPVERAYRLVERVLARNTTVYAVCSNREAGLAENLGGPGRVRLVVNVAHQVPEALPSPGQDFIIAGAGRIVPQKGVPRFARLARETAADLPGASFVWVGGGREDLTADLVESGVEVTGWLAKGDVLNVLSRSHLYVHSADWEGSPVGLLEAVACGVPTIVIDRPYAEGLPAEMVATDATLVARVRELAEDADARARILSVARLALAENTVPTQSDQLRGAYEAALGSRRQMSRPVATVR